VGGGFSERGNETSGCIKKAGYFLTIRVTINFSNNVLHHGASEQASKQASKQRQLSHKKDNPVLLTGPNWAKEVQY
jgi:hypothetical protein